MLCGFCWCFVFFVLLLVCLCFGFDVVILFVFLLYLGWSYATLFCWVEVLFSCFFWVTFMICNCCFVCLCWYWLRLFWCSPSFFASVLVVADVWLCYFFLALLLLLLCYFHFFILAGRVGMLVRGGAFSKMRFIVLVLGRFIVLVLGLLKAEQSAAHILVACYLVDKLSIEFAVVKDMERRDAL